jgi:hypothetical protein
MRNRIAVTEKSIDRALVLVSGRCAMLSFGGSGAGTSCWRKRVEQTDALGVVNGLQPSHRGAMRARFAQL